MGSYCIRSLDFSLLSVPKAHTELGNGAFKYASPSALNQLQNYMNLRPLVSLVILVSNFN